MIKTTDGIEFCYRENTSDIKAIEEACGKIPKGPTKSAYTRTHKEPKFVIENNDVWLDIGAHIGAFSLRAIKDGASHVYAIEPHPENGEMLRRNMQLNHFSVGKISFMPLAIGGNNCHDTGTLNITVSTYRHTLLKPTTKSTGANIIVKMRSLDNLLSSYPSINAIKIDAEGSEVDILKYSDLFCTNIAKIVFEYSFDHFPVMKDFFALCELIRSKGYDVYHKPSLANVGENWNTKTSRGNNGALVWAKRRVLSIPKQLHLTTEDAGYFYVFDTNNRFKYLSETPYVKSDEIGQGWVIIDKDVRIIDEKTGELVLVFLKDRIEHESLNIMTTILKPVAIKSGNNNRGVAGGRIDIERIKSHGRPGLQIGKMGEFSLYPKKKDGTTSKSHFGNPTDSAIIGWTDIALRTDKQNNVRLTKWTLENPEKFARVLPCIELVNTLFKKSLYTFWQKQADVAFLSNAHIGNTVFSSVTINHNFRSALHQDKGDYKKGFGVFFVHQHGCSGELLLPEYKLIIRLKSSDLLLFNPHVWHCTAPIDPNADRTTFVCYYRERLIDQQTAKESNNKKQKV